MRHNKAGRRLGRTTSHRIAMFRNMVTSFLEHERITTTDAKAKELRSIAEKMITLGKRGDLHALRQAASYIRDKKVVTKLFSTIAPRYKERDGGYTRIIKLGIRPGDNAPLSVIELVEEQLNKKGKKAKPAKATIAAAAPVVEQAAASLAEEPAVAGEDAPLTTVNDAAEECEGKAD
ncbi:50S ribosomal protein L17 [Geobacter hydrogenophilus]|uniref:Large ribosomal subunit protein bL17 n=1 Tax=Geobacter hydrogenophilus TaxID=40983 RepID=A0A9W6G0Q5_9BACT|nr:50S ribosomal protein L17 [Geobacter hydrogenophilus]MBT0892851.1 50S ribosomal protein L17 [Geobacter hydrogenophilus]GLI38674.1 50S ribosomal protein L17 [Geobacter hydrogenophilus]